MQVATITPRDFDTLRQSGQAVDLIDVRTPVEFRELHATPARNISLEAIDVAGVNAARLGPTDQPVYFICRTGSRSQQACAKLVSSGYTNVVTIEGGTLAWAEAGLPVVRGKKAVSLERQVRIAAGALSFLGAILGWFVHPAFVGLSAFVGAGLVFAGITDTCGMGLMLARMPWNQVPKTPETCSIH